MSNQLVAIGGIGQYRVYLNVSLEEAKRRYEEIHNDVDWDRLDIKIYDIDDEFQAYDIWWYPESTPSINR